MDNANKIVLENTAVQSDAALVGQWLDQLNVALHSESQTSVASLFAPDGHWRDLLAFTWSITPSQGAKDIAALMVAKQGTAKARGFAIAEGRTPPRRVQRAGIDVIEGIFQFETAVGRGFGVVRLPVNEPSKAFQLMTSLHELKGFEEKIGKRCPTGEAFSRNFGGTNWKEQRDAIQAYSDREPAVLIVGGGQAGLSLAAIIIAAQLIWPELNLTPWLSYGRLRPLHTNAVIFAFGGSALFTTSYYVVQRTCHARLFSPALASFTFWGWQAVIVLAAVTLCAFSERDVRS